MTSGCESQTTNSHSVVDTTGLALCKPYERNNTRRTCRFTSIPQDGVRGELYTGSITVTSSGSSQTIRISLTVTNAPTLTVAPRRRCCLVI